MAIGNSSEMIEQRRYLREGDVEISERAFNLVIGGMLLWGFLLNYLMVALFGDQIARMVNTMNPLVFLLGYLALAILGSVLIAKNGPALSFVGYNLIAVPVGAVVCACVSGVPAATVKSAVLLTAIVTLAFMILSMVFPGFFLRLGRVLGVSLLILIIGELAAIFIFHSHSMIFEWIAAGIFSLYIGYDWARANTCAHTLDNAIDLSASMYLDIINLFLRILRIMSKRRD